MKVNYVLMYGTPYLKYKEFETFEDVSKFLVHKGIVNYSIFKKLEDREEIEMIYRDNDINYLKKIIKEAKSFLDDNTKFDYQGGDYDNHLMEWYEIINMTENNFIRGLYDILYKENKQ